MPPERVTLSPKILKPIEQGDLMKKLAIVLALSTHFAFAIEPNDFECRGEGAEVRYSSTSFSGRPLFSVVYENHPMKLPAFPEVKVQSTPVGKLVTVSDFRLALVDGPEVRYSIVIPTISLQSLPSTETFESVMVVTSLVNPFFRPGPRGFAAGVLEKNEFVAVTCTGSLGVF